VTDVVSPNDYQATLLHLFGMDHDQIIFPVSGRDQTITDGRAARIVKEILA
jgi:hypothetical protein